MFPHDRLFGRIAPTDMRQNDAPTARRTHPGLALPALPVLIGPLVFDSRDSEIAAEGLYGLILEVPPEIAEGARPSIIDQCFGAVLRAHIAETHDKRRRPEASVECRQIVLDESAFESGDRFLDFGDDLGDVEFKHLCNSVSDVCRVTTTPC